MFKHLEGFVWDRQSVASVLIGVKTTDQSDLVISVSVKLPNSKSAGGCGLAVEDAVLHAEDPGSILAGDAAGWLNADHFELVGCVHRGNII